MESNAHQGKTFREAVLRR